MIKTDDSSIRQSNIELFPTMLGNLGHADFDKATSYLAEDVYCDWPYIPAPGLAATITGRQKVKNFFTDGMSDFEPYK